MSVSVPRAECRSDSSIVMICFSPDDTFLLSSAIDNELRQYTTVDGRLCLKIDSARTGCLENYTRSYYMNGGDVIISGSSEANVQRVHRRPHARRAAVPRAEALVAVCAESAGRPPHGLRVLGAGELQVCGLVGRCRFVCACAWLHVRGY